jgi:hypothetical protein
VLVVGGVVSVVPGGIAVMLAVVGVVVVDGGKTDDISRTSVIFANVPSSATEVSKKQRVSSAFRHAMERVRG